MEISKRLFFVFTILLVACQPDNSTPVKSSVSHAEMKKAENSTNDEESDWITQLTIGLPKDASAVVKRSALCNHFSGEINGDRSKRDKEVFAEMDKLKCHTIDQDVLNIKDTYVDNPDVLIALDRAVEM